MQGTAPLTDDTMDMPADNLVMALEACIANDAGARRNAPLRRNHIFFFDAPVGLLLTIDRDLGQCSWLNVPVAAFTRFYE